MSAITNWFSAGSDAQKHDVVELETRGEGEHDVANEHEQKLLPDMTDEEIDRMKLEKAKAVKRQQVCVAPLVAFGVRNETMFFLVSSSTILKAATAFPSLILALLSEAQMC